MIAPIPFDSLKPQALPLERFDIIGQDVDVVRVSLAAAVQFIISLEVREDLANPKDEISLDSTLFPYSPKGFEENRQVCRSPDVWADAIMVAAEKHGYDNVIQTWDSIRRVQSALIGEDFSELIQSPFGHRWR